MTPRTIFSVFLLLIATVSIVNAKYNPDDIWRTKLNCYKAACFDNFWCETCMLFRSKFQLREYRYCIPTAIGRCEKVTV